MNIITYDQLFVFNHSQQGQSSSTLENGNGNVSEGLLELTELTQLPFNCTPCNIRLGTELKVHVQALKNLKLPLETPTVPNQEEYDWQSRNHHHRHDDRQGLTQWMIAIIFIAVAAIFSAVAIAALRRMDRDLQLAAMMIVPGRMGRAKQNGTPNRRVRTDPEMPQPTNIVPSS